MSKRIWYTMWRDSLRISHVHSIPGDPSTYAYNKFEVYMSVVFLFSSLVYLWFIFYLHGEVGRVRRECWEEGVGESVGKKGWEKVLGRRGGKVCKVARQME